ncbi:MAG: hypothetical protein AAF478_02800 [Pseudomonadota bacterium]
MSISNQLLALLSVDAYNRDYDSGIVDGGQGDPDGLGESGSVGNARILARPDNINYDEWISTGRLRDQNMQGSQ